MSEPTDTNQTGEDELVQQIEAITQTMFVTLSEWQAGVSIDWQSAKVKGRADLLALIRTEKLKLLDRLSAVFCDAHIDSALDVERKKLEAEL